MIFNFGVGPGRVLMSNPQVAKTLFQPASWYTNLNQFEFMQSLVGRKLWREYFQSMSLEGIVAVTCFHVMSLWLVWLVTFLSPDDGHRLLTWLVVSLWLVPTVKALKKAPTLHAPFVSCIANTIKCIMKTDVGDWCTL